MSSGQLTRTITSGALVASLAIVGCGSAAPPTKTISQPGIKFNGRSATIEFISPIAGRRGIPILYTCDGKDISPPLGWGTIPPETSELVLFMLSFGRTRSLSAQWAIAGLNPNLHVLEAGKLPPEAILGSNAHHQTRYSLCPPKHTLQSYIFIIYALPRPLHLHRGFSAGALISRISDPSYPDQFGAFVTVYARA
jgi:phosphatidylethanolamine-binding protein (PEBP) family uncharacterized protein